MILLGFEWQYLQCRFLVLGFVNFLELIVCFSAIYAFDLTKLKGAMDPWAALYFSVVTQLTIGYGDLKPLAELRAVAAIQGLSGLSFLALVFTRAITALKAIHEIIAPDWEESAPNAEVCAQSEVEK